MKGRGLFSGIGLAIVFCGMLAIGVYTGLEEPDETDDGVYKLTDIAMKVNVDEGYSGKVLTESPVLIIHGDKKKVKKLKKQKTIPEVVIDMRKKGEGEYVGVPKVVGELFRVNYNFEPKEIEVEVLEATEHKFPVYERDYGLAGEGMKVESLYANDKAVLVITEEQERAIGQVLAEVNVDGLDTSGDYDADVVVLDKRGDIMDVEVLTPTVPVYVTIEPMGWYQTMLDIDVLKDEIGTLEVELAERVEEEKKVQDVLKKSDLRKEIDFRDKRLKQKRQELDEKQEGLSEMKIEQEYKKQEGEKKSVRKGGRIEEDEEKDKIDEGK